MRLAADGFRVLDKLSRLSGAIVARLHWSLLPPLKGCKAA